uniref:Cullin 9 n=1 Tax=Poecilia formosa TaxID=48698 RepID=A0A096LTL3_POEFO
MVGERRNGNLLVQLGPSLQAYPEELIRQRRTHDGQTEYLIRWCLVTVDDGSSCGGGAENILMWMTMEDVFANCPTLLGKRKAEAQRPLQPQEKQLGGEATDGAPQGGEEFPADVTFDEVELSDMKQDVKNLVCRARKQMAKKSDFSINIMHTIHVLSAYASIGSLVGVFKETGALNLLMELLCNKETQTRRSAGKMLRALASHDAGSRAYVLLSLSQQDGIEQHMDFDNRFTLLELFAETTSSEEHGISFEGIHLPQIPGKLLFSLVKRYLCVTSLMDKLNTAEGEPGSERQDGSPAPTASGSAHQTELLRLQKEFDFTMAMANLISELVRVMGWDRNRKPPDGSGRQPGGGVACSEERAEEVPRPILRSIFQPRFCTSSVSPAAGSPVSAPAATPTKKRGGNGFKARSDFSSRSAYVEYVQDSLKSGMAVRMLEDYEEVSAGDEGEFRYSNDGSPPVQVYWNSLSRTYWVHWHMVEILGSGSSSQSDRETQEKASTLTETLKLTAASQPDVLLQAAGRPVLSALPDEVQPDDASLIGLSVPGDVSKKLLHYLKQALPSWCLGDLLLVELRHYLGVAQLFLGGSQQLAAQQLGLCLQGGDTLLHLLLHLQDRKLQLQPDSSKPFSGQLNIPENEQIKDLLLFSVCRFLVVQLCAAFRRMGHQSIIHKISSTWHLVCKPELSVEKQKFLLMPYKYETETWIISLYRPVINSFTGQKLQRTNLVLYQILMSQIESVMESLNTTMTLTLTYSLRINYCSKDLFYRLLTIINLHSSPAAPPNHHVSHHVLIFHCSASEFLCHNSHLVRRSVLCPASPVSGFCSMCGCAGRLGSVSMGKRQTDINLLKQRKQFRGTHSEGIVILVITGLSERFSVVLPWKRAAFKRCCFDVITELKKTSVQKYQTKRRRRAAIDTVAARHDLMLHNTVLPSYSKRDNWGSAKLVHVFLSLLKSGSSKNLVSILYNGILEVRLSKLVNHVKKILMVLRDSNYHRFNNTSLYLLLDFSGHLLNQCIWPNGDTTRPQTRTATSPCRRRSCLREREDFILLCLSHNEETLSGSFGSDGSAVPVLIHSVCHTAAHCAATDTDSILTDIIQPGFGSKDGGESGRGRFLKTRVDSSSLRLRSATARVRIVLGSFSSRNENLADLNISCVLFWSLLLNLVLICSIGVAHLTAKYGTTPYFTGWVATLQGWARIATGTITSNLPAIIISINKCCIYMSVVNYLMGRISDPTGWGTDPICSSSELKAGQNENSLTPGAVWRLKEFVLFAEVLNRSKELKTLISLVPMRPGSWHGSPCWMENTEWVVNLLTRHKRALLTKTKTLQFQPLSSSHGGPGSDPVLTRFPVRVCVCGCSFLFLISPRSIQQPCAVCLLDGKEGKNKDSPAASSSSSSSSSKPKVKSSSSIAGIALCWQGVVQRQVKKFLESSCSLPDFVERYRSLYLRLKNAMEELFGQQTAFVLALRHGFSAALLQLSILRAMHVSERFAQYIDQMIQASAAPSGGVETLERLQQFLEPMLFLSGLELANTFEHFYRYYLGDRLLAQGNVWLESAVIDQIGSCFPSRFPQQMLKNLRESVELQQEFHLYRLQQLDRHLQEQDQQVMEDWVESEEEAEVQVLVLSPRCWAVSSGCFLDEPAKHFPAELCSYLNHFTQFYSHSQSMYSLSHSKPRRLQWTWLGHGELRLGGWTLHVSTLQMFILLHFNAQEEVRVQQLLQESGLSAAVLLHALQPLIADGGPLTCSSEEEPSTAVLQLNQQVASRSLQGVPASLQLLPRQTYLNVDEDAAGTLERKRNFIYCLIVHIMKQEKEMHIDNLVFKVMDSCQKQEAARSPGGGRFGCSTGDVLSCIMHVINKGCVRRNDDNPHIVEFVPEDPATPQKGHAQFSFGRAGSSLVPAPLRFEDGVLDSVLFSMGRTMTQEEVRQLMQRTVQQVSVTLSLDSDRAEHLLIHCRWNVDLLVQRYTDDPDALIMAAGLTCRNPQPPSPAPTCPVCLGPRGPDAEPVPTLSCMHYCCRSCWQEYLTARIEQNLVMNCNCPITDCQAQPTSQFFLGILTDRDTIAKYENALLRGYVECCSNLTWCTNPQGCDQILCKEAVGSMGTCSRCCWSSCFSCNFPEAHYPASCSHMSQWMDDGGFYEGMSMEAQSKHLAKLISKRCPSCQAQIEKNEGCLHMTCAKCNHGFCWRCLKPWKPTHKDYYNCSAMVSKAARQEKKFQDYNERCTFHHQAKDFAVGLESKVSSINEALQMKSLTFVIDACKVLAQARKVLAYSCVYSYYNQETEKMDVMEQQTEALDLHTNALQILLEETLLQCTDLASCVRLLKPEHLNTGLELIRRIQERLLAILQHSTQDFRVGYQTKSGQEPETTQASSLSNHTDTNKGSKSKSNRGSDSGDENLERDFSP